MRHHQPPSSATVVRPPLDCCSTGGGLGTLIDLQRTHRPRRTGMVRDASMLLRERLLETLDEARARTGRDLPAGQTEDDPATGLVDEELR